MALSSRIHKNISLAARYGFCAAVAVVGLAALGCGGTPLPEGFSFGTGDSQTGQEALPALSFGMSVQVMGDEGGGGSPARAGRTGAASFKGTTSSRSPARSHRRVELENRRRAQGSAASARTSQTSAATSNDGNETGFGANGNDPVDLDGDNLYVGGLTDTIDAVIIFRAQGATGQLAALTLSGGTAQDLQLSDRALGAGRNLQVEITTAGGTSIAIVPSSFFAGDAKYGFNIYRRADSSLVLELFPDKDPPFTVSDNGTRVIIDTAIDVLRTGVLTTAARFETPDGLVLWDINLDGNFGRADDLCILYDTNGDGEVDASDAPTSYAIDPNLDGTLSEGEERLIGANISEDFINNVTPVATPADVVGNGLSTISVVTDVEPSPDGIPIGAVLNYTVTLVEGTLSGATAEEQIPAAFIRNGLSTLSRTIDPLDSSVRIFADGRMQLTDALRVPAMDVDGKLHVSVTWLTSSSNAERMNTAEVIVRKNTSPKLGRVSFSGTRTIPATSTGLEDSSDAADVVFGNLVQLIGENFATDPAGMIVTFNGTTAVVTSASADGTTITTSVPVGATTGRISVLQGGVAALTVQDFVIAGEPLQLVGSSPDDNDTNVPRDAAIILRFNQPLDASSVEDGLNFLDSNGLFVAGTANVSDDGKTLTFRPAQSNFPQPALAASSDYTVQFTGFLAAASGARFDPIVDNTVVAVDESPEDVVTFTTGTGTANDSTAPTVSSSDTDTNLVAGATASDDWVLSIGFDEPMNAGTIFASDIPSESDTVRLRRDSDSSLVAIKILLSDAGDAALGTVTEALFGLEDYTLEVAAEAEDLAKNGLGGMFTKTFSLGLIVTGMSAISGPEGSEVVISGSTFEDGNTTVTFNGDDANVLETSATEIRVEVPTGAGDGPVEVSVGSESALAPIPFTVTSAGFVVREIAQGAGAFGIALDRSNNAMISYQGAGEVGFMNLATEVTRDADTAAAGDQNLTVGGVPTDAALDRTGTAGFTTNYGTAAEPGESVFFVNVTGMQVLAAVPVGKRPTRLAVSPDNRLLFVTNFLDDTVSVINIAEQRVETSFATGRGPNGVAVSPDNKRIYVANFMESTVTVVDAATFGFVGKVVTGANPARCILSPDSATLFVSNYGDNTVSVIDVTELTVTQTVKGLSGPSAMDFTPSGDELYIANRRSDTLVSLTLDADLWKLSGTKIAAAGTPAGLRVTSDGMLLAFTSETAGKLSSIRIGNPTPVIESFALDTDDAAGANTFSVDARRSFWILGRGFGGDVTEVTATIAGVELEIDAASFSRTAFRATLPQDAVSGPVVVTLDDGTNVTTSNEAALLVTGKTPRVVRMVPGDGASRVSASTNVVIEFSEPLDLTTIFNDEKVVRKIQGVPVMRVVRLSDTGGSPTVMSGTWTVDAYARTFTFTLDSGTSFISADSNNRYEVVVSPAVKDLFSNAVAGSVTSFAGADSINTGSSTTTGNLAASAGFRGRFQTLDLRGPSIRRALYRDRDNNGVDAGDEVVLVFDEQLFFESLDFELASFVTLGGAGGSVGTTFDGTIGTSSLRVSCTLGAGADITFGTGGTTINLANDSINAFHDFSGQRPRPGSTAVALELDPATDNGERPRLLVAAWLDADTSSSVTAGDTLRLYFNEPVLLGAGAADPTTLFTLSGVGSLGTASFAAREAGKYRQVDITLGVGAALTSGTTTIAPVGAGTPPVMNDDEILDFGGNAAYADTYATVTIRTGAPGAAALDAGTSPTHVDIDGTRNGLSFGDAIVVAFTNPVALNSFAGEGRALHPADLFALGVPGDRFGAGARVAQPAAIKREDGSTRFINPNEIVIVLGTDPVITPKGTFGVPLSGSPAMAGRIRGAGE